MILIHPPLVKPCEPPAGIAMLAGALRENQVKFTFIDANLEGINSLLNGDHFENSVLPVSDLWTSRSLRHLNRNMKFLKSPEGYICIDRYKEAVGEINRVLQKSADNSNVFLSLSNYLDRDLSPVRSRDLFASAENPHKNPFYSYFKKRLTKALESESPEMVGLSLNYLSQALCAFAIIGFLKKEYPRLRVVLGGGLITSWMNSSSWKNPFAGLVDDLIAGPGEAALLSILGVNKERKYYSPDSCVLSDNEYFALGHVLPYSTSSGCYWGQCSFCPEKAEGNPFNPKPADIVITQLRNLTAKIKPALVHLVDSAISPAILNSIAGNHFGSPWYGFARVTPHLTDIDFCLALKKSGCVMLQLGVESGDQGVIDYMNKGFDLETVSIALTNLKKSGISTYVYLLFGTPSESLPEARKTLEFIVRHSEYIDFMNIAIFNMPKNSPDAKKLETSNFYDGDLSLYSNFLHPHQWSRQRIRNFLGNEFRKNKLVATILKRSPPLFGVNHAPFFVISQKNEYKFEI